MAQQAYRLQSEGQIGYNAERLLSEGPCLEVIFLFFLIKLFLQRAVLLFTIPPALMRKLHELSEWLELLFQFTGRAADVTCREQPLSNPAAHSELST